MGTDDGQRFSIQPVIYASVCPCAELSESLVVAVVPILSFFSQVTNSQKHLRNHSWHSWGWCKSHCDVHTFSITCPWLLFWTRFWHFTSAPLSFMNIPFNVFCCLFVTAALTLKLLLCATGPHAYIHVLSCCCRCFLSLSVFLSFSHSVLSLPSDAARCHNAAVTAGAGAITGHTHHGKHTCIYMFTNHTHSYPRRPLLVTSAVLIRCLKTVGVIAARDQVAFCR